MNKRSGKLIVTRGLPGSGKTSWALEQDAVRVNRDDLRRMLFGADGILPWDQEELVTQAQQSAVRHALKHDRNVVVDDTNLRLKYVRVWEQMAFEEDCAFEVVDFITPLKECINRDLIRRHRGERYVGAQVIEMLHEKFLNQHGGVLPPYQYTVPEDKQIRKYVAGPGSRGAEKPFCIIVDIDGTLAHRQEVNGSTRGPFDWHRVHEDAPDYSVIAVVASMHRHSYRIVYVSGRDEVCRKDTESWIHDYVGIPGPLYMRSEGDNRKDTIVKAELFWDHIADAYEPVFSLDDRDSVVQMWRDMGIKCLQCQPGAF